MCVCVCVCVCARAHVCACVCAFVCLHVCVCVCVVVVVVDCFPVVLFSTLEQTQGSLSSMTHVIYMDLCLLSLSACSRQLSCRLPRLVVQGTFGALTKLRSAAA